LNDVPIWAWLLVTTGVIALLGVAGFFIWRWGWHRASRRYLVKLISRKESIAASQRTLEAILRHLAEESDEELLAFATDPEALERRALGEEHQRCVVLRDELDTMPMPKRLVPVAEALADVAGSVADETGLFDEDQSEEAVLQSLQALDLDEVGERYARAEELIEEACGYYGVEEAVVYGGGLYI
jgi:hypothetical protein